MKKWSKILFAAAISSTVLCFNLISDAKASATSPAAELQALNGDMLGNMAYGKPATASNVIQISNNTNLALYKPVTVSDYFSELYTGAMAVDGNSGTRWATPDNTTTATLDVDFGANTTFDKITFSQLGTRVGSYKIQYWNGSEWVDAYAKTTAAAANETATFTPVTGSKVRFFITSAINGPGGPSIWEFSVFNTQGSGTNPDPLYAASNAVDADPSTRWATQNNIQTATLDVDLGTNTTFSKVEFFQVGQRIGSYKIQYWNGAEWLDAYTGGTAATRESAVFSPVTGSKVRLNITSVLGTTGPSIYEFEVYNIDANKGLSRASRVLIDKGLQQQAWIATDQTGRYFPSASDWTGIHFTAPTYYEEPMYNQTFHNALPNSQWSLAKAPFAQHLSSGPTSNDHFLNEQQRANLSNLVSMQFGDEEKFSKDVVSTLKGWYDLSHTLYPSVMVHNNQWGGQWTADHYRSYVRAAKPDILTYDSYYFSKPGQYVGGSLKPLYDGLNKVRIPALEGYDGTGQSPIAYGLYTQGFKEGSGTYTPSESEINIVSSATWTMGGKWTNLFRWEIGESGDIFLLNDKNGNLTPTYDQYAELARQGNNLGPHMVRLTSTDVRFVPGQHKAGSITVNNTAPDTVALWNTAADPYIQSIQATNLGTTNNGLRGDVLVGYFEPLSGLTTQDASLLSSPDAKYFMIMNGLTASTPSGSSSATSEKIDFTFDLGEDSQGLQLKRVSRDTGLVEVVPLTQLSGSQYSLEITLGGGIADLFFWDRNLTSPVTIDDAKSGWQSAGQTVHLTATDEGGSGLQATYYSVDDSPFVQGNTIEITNEGVHTIKYYSTDKAGNQEDLKSATVKIDLTGPVITSTVSMAVYQTDAIQLQFAITDSLSGVSNSVVKLDDATIANPATLSPLSLSVGNHNIQVSAQDIAGNSSLNDFTLQVVMDTDHLDELVNLGVENNWITNDGIAQSLLSKVKNIQNVQDKGESIENALNSLENEVRAQTGKHIDSAYAQLLLADIAYLQAPFKNN
ncbi:hypothetical protein BVG16_27900 [Paenibacillus selenitireducens]|uniref:F5/8 type C domain-containing protein n=1 Tax=Paenibacillus selenitireducens TaxID=1324314 RepID=A0A1T2X1A2_9BACL|nr:discoidin domain-containing protein [Paenibacillus selenitireducens]OPA73631.1 hypothetical protein BVG16_27900 [Paenibacillus selenitireducens]